MRALAGQFRHMRVEVRALPAAVKGVQRTILSQRVEHAATIGAAERAVAGLFARDLAGPEEIVLPGLDQRRRDLRGEPDAGDQHRLVNQVEREAVAADEDQRAREARRRKRAEPAEKARRRRQFRRRHAGEHHAEPWEKRHIVVGAQRERRQADPP